MTTAPVEQRRDPRYYLKEDGVVAEFDDPVLPDTRWIGRLVALSAAGIHLELDEIPELAEGTILHDVTLRIGNCRISGSVAIKNLRSLESGGCQIGGLFYPGSEMETSRLMALIAGMDAVDCNRPG